MVSISRETTEQTEQRLRGVIAAAELVHLPGAWGFEEFPEGTAPTISAATIAVVRDERRWSALRPLGEGFDATEHFGILSFHFPPGLDNSGFVGWLASALKQELGSGVFVICGSNSERGGIYDYWGYPVDLRDEVVRVIGALRGN